MSDTLMGSLLSFVEHHNDPRRPSMIVCMISRSWSGFIVPAENHLMGAFAHP